MDYWKWEKQDSKEPRWWTRATKVVFLRPRPQHLRNRSRSWSWKPCSWAIPANWDTGASFYIVTKGKGPENLKKQSIRRQSSIIMSQRSWQQSSGKYSIVDNSIKDTLSVYRFQRNLTSCHHRTGLRIIEMDGIGAINVLIDKYFRACARVRSDLSRDRHVSLKIWVDSTYLTTTHRFSIEPVKSKPTYLTPTQLESRLGSFVLVLRYTKIETLKQSV